MRTARLSPLDQTSLGVVYVRELELVTQLVLDRPDLGPDAGPGVVRHLCLEVGVLGDVIAVPVSTAWSGACKKMMSIVRLSLGLLV